jgi:hypothetical protein
MDLNYLLGRHQISLARSMRAESGEARHAHAGFAKLYEQKIDALRSSKFPVDHMLRTLTHSTVAVNHG